MTKPARTLGRDAPIRRPAAESRGLRGGLPSVAHSIRRSGSFSPVLFLENRLEFGDDLEVLGAACCALDVDEVLEPETVTGDPEHLDADRMRQEVLIGTAADDLAEKIEIAQVGGQ